MASKDKVDQLIEELLKKNLGPQSGSYAGTGKKTVQQGKTYSKRGQTPAMGFKVDDNVKKPGRTSSRSKRLRTKIRQLRNRKNKSTMDDPIAMSKKGGSVSRKKGSKIMQGYKAGGKV